jgi:cytochrome c
VVGDKKAEGNFNFSAALKSKGGEWTFDELNKFLQNPRGYVPGTSMSFAGVSRDGQRADIIAFLTSLSDKPVPLPKAAQAGGGQQDQAAPQQPKQ